MCKHSSCVAAVYVGLHSSPSLIWSTAGAYYPAQPQFTPSVQAAPVIMNPAPQQQQPPPQPPQHIHTKRERKQVRSVTRHTRGTHTHSVHKVIRSKSGLFVLITCVFYTQTADLCRHLHGYNTVQKSQSTIRFDVVVFLLRYKLQNTGNMKRKFS